MLNRCLLRSTVCAHQYKHLRSNTRTQTTMFYNFAQKRYATLYRTQTSVLYKEQQQEARTHVFFYFFQQGSTIILHTILLYVNLCTNTLYEHHLSSLLSKYILRSTVRTTVYNEIDSEKEQDSRTLVFYVSYILNSTARKSVYNHIMQTPSKPIAQQASRL